MKKEWLLVLVIVFVVIASLISVYPAEVGENIMVKEPKTTNEEKQDYAPNEVLVKFKEGVLSEKIEEIFNEFNLTKISEIKKLKINRLKVPSGTIIQETINRLEKNPSVEFAEPNYYVYTSFVPNDPFYCLQWHLDDSLKWDPVNEICTTESNPHGGIHMESAWDVTTGNTSVMVAVLDTGVAYERFSDPNPANCYNRIGQLKKCPGSTIDEYYQAPDLANTIFLIITGSDLVNSDNHPNDDESHGTHVTGTVAQSTNNNLGVAGVAFNTAVMPIKVLDAKGNGLSSVVGDGILLAADNGAKIISMSLGSSSPSSTIESAVNYAYNNGVTVIAACGNGGSGGGCDYPAAFSNVISVGATQYDKTKAPYSNFGSNLDLVAPGGNTGVDQNGDGYADGVLQQTFGSNVNTSDFAYWFFQGTSMATPHVSGVAALLLALNSSLTPDDIRNILTSTADDLGATGRDNTYGWGLVNASAAVNNVIPSSDFISITLFDYPIDFSNKDPGTIDNPGIGNPHTVRIDPESTVNVDLYQKGDDFSGNPSVLGIENMSWLDSNNSLNSYVMSKNYNNNISNILPGTNVSVYYWLDIPQGQTGGDYNTTIFIKAVKIGTSP
ncbi:S8 family serine peptidase [Candidatus Pacearchaeota archaeon]|nr:S8 family serine peptidase [Candidatus Pacearchaeota archaeon]